MILIWRTSPTWTTDRNEVQSMSRSRSTTVQNCQVEWLNDFYKYDLAFSIQLSFRPGQNIWALNWNLISICFRSFTPTWDLLSLWYTLRVLDCIVIGKVFPRQHGSGCWSSQKSTVILMDDAGYRHASFVKRKFASYIRSCRFAWQALSLFWLLKSWMNVSERR